MHSRNSTVLEPVDTSHLNGPGPDSGAQDAESTSFDSNAVYPSNLFVSSSTPHLVQQDSYALAFEITNSHLPGVDAHQLSGSEPVSPPHPAEPNPGTQAVDNSARHVHDVLPTGISRFDSAVSDLSEAEQQSNVPSASAQVPTRYVCDINNLDGSPCLKTFASSASRRQHQVASVHMRPMPCPFCSNTRHWQSQNLLKHVRKHHQERLWTDFRCQICSSRLPDSLRALAAHVGVWHRDLSLQERYDVTRGF